MINKIANSAQFQAELDVLAMLDDPRIPTVRAQIEALFARGYGTRLPVESRASLPAFSDEFLNNWLFKAAASDAQHPRLVRNFLPAHEWFGHQVVGARTGGDNPDNCYRLVGIEHGTRYRLRGKIIDQKPANTSFTLTANYGTSQTIQTVEDHELRIDDDGSFQIEIDDKESDGNPNHLTTRPGVKFLFIRDSMMDWSKETPIDLTIERLDAAKAEPISLEEMTTRAIDHALNDLYLYFWFQNVWSGLAPNSITPAAGIKGGGGLVTQALSNGTFNLGPDDAAIIEYDPAGAGYCGIQLTEWLYRSLDYQLIQSSLTAALSSVDQDGLIRVVIARRDPGVHNWLDTGGQAHVHSIMRWQKMATNGRPISARLQMTTIDQLSAYLPTATVWMSPKDRTVQIAERIASFQRRITN